MAVTAPAIGRDEQASSLRIQSPAIVVPPTTDRGRGEWQPVLRECHPPRCLATGIGVGVPTGKVVNSLGIAPEFWMVCAAARRRTGSAESIAVAAND